MKRLWKKPAIKISAAVLIVIGLALLALWISSLRTPPLMSFDFLSGRVVTARIEEGSHKEPRKTVWQAYSFEADFNEVCKAADAELTGVGFRVIMLGPQELAVRKYLLSGSNYDSQVTVSIRDRHRLIVYSTPKSSDYSSPDRYGYHYRVGWITVEIEERRLRLWPPQHLLYRLLWKLRTPTKTTQTQVGGSGAKQ